jgi:hypothetical protein
VGVADSLGSGAGRLRRPLWVRVMIYLILALFAVTGLIWVIDLVAKGIH